MIVLDLAPTFLVGLLLGKATGAEWRRWARLKIRRLELGIPISGERWEHDIIDRFKHKHWSRP